MIASTEFLSFSFKNSSNIAASSSRYCSASSSFFSSACQVKHMKINEWKLYLITEHVCTSNMIIILKWLTDNFCGSINLKLVTSALNILFLSLSFLDTFKWERLLGFKKILWLLNSQDLIVNSPLYLQHIPWKLVRRI